MNAFLKALAALLQALFHGKPVAAAADAPGAEVVPIPEYVTGDELLLIAPKLGDQAKARDMAAAINRAMHAHGITTFERVAAFLAQTAHESTEYTRWAENMNYTSPARLRLVWPSRFKAMSDAQLAHLVRNPENLANEVYSNRMGNGSPASGDGFRYRARGPIGLTGRYNYQRAQDHLHLPLVSTPELVTDDVAIGWLVAAWWWADNGCNEITDSGDFKALTKRINGGLTGYDDRLKYLERARRALS